MNTKMVLKSLTLGILYAFVFASTASAFWPFDALFNKGEVKAVVTDKMYAGDVRPENGKAFMTYQTLVSMNDNCRRMFSRDYPTPTKPKITPSAREGINAKKMSADVEKETNSMYLQEFGVESKNEKEFTVIYNNLKARCENVANLVSRMQKIYKGSVKPTVLPTEYTTPTPIKEVTAAPTTTTTMSCGGIRGTKCPEGYTCSYKTETNKPGKITVDTMGTCVKLDTKEFNIKGR